MTSWKLASECLKVLRSKSSLMILPLLGAVCSALLTLVFAIPLSFVEWTENGPLIVLTLFVFYFSQQFIRLFVNASFLHCLASSLKGRDVSLLEGVSFSIGRLDKIISWAILGGGVGVILNRLDKKAEGSRIRQFVSKVFGGAWELVSYFAFPILILENLGPTQAMRRSLTLILNTWGERVRAAMGFQSLGFVTTLVGVGMAVLGGLLGHHFGSTLCFWVTGFVVGFYTLLCVFVLSCLVQVYRVSLYLYTTEPSLSQALPVAAFEGAFKREV